MIYALAFAASYVFVGLKSFQQLNVARGKYRFVLPTSLAMAVCEAYVIVAFANAGFGWLILPVGVAAGCGAMSAMWLHSKF